MTECSVCSRDTVSGSDLCGYHEEALTRLHAAFKEWERAMGIEWKEYLVSICRTEGLGLWVREVAVYLISKNAALGPS